MHELTPDNDRFLSGNIADASDVLSNDQNLKAVGTNNDSRLIVPVPRATNFHMDANGGWFPCNYSLSTIPNNFSSLDPQTDPLNNGKPLDPEQAQAIKEMLKHIGLDGSQ